MQLDGKIVEKLTFQYSIGDAAAKIKEELRAIGFDLSILHWRCGYISFTADGGDIVISFQYSIGDARDTAW